jgi:hypothetical protein
MATTNRSGLLVFPSVSSLSYSISSLNILEVDGYMTEAFFLNLCEE